jgi:flagellar biosynthesis GTPase FlhF
MTAVVASVLPSYLGVSRAMVVVGPAGPTTTIARLSPRYEGKTEATTAVIELLMIGGKTSETC